MRAASTLRARFIAASTTPVATADVSATAPLAAAGITPTPVATARVAAEKLRRPLARLNTHLQGRDWLVGNRFTVADINTAECLRYAQGNKALIAEFPDVQRWLTTAQSRPAFQKMWAGRMAEPA